MVLKGCASAACAVLVLVLSAVLALPRLLHDPVVQVPGARDLSGRNVVITGGNSGVGLEAAKELARQGAKVLITSRSAKRAAEKSESFGGDGAELDLSDFTAVRRFASELQLRFAEKPLDILILNAGMLYGQGHTGPYLTADGKDVLVASNHLGNWLLVHELQPLLERSRSRIVVVASIAHWFADSGMVMPSFPVANEGEGLGEIGSMQLYGVTKLQNVLFTYKLQRELAASGVSAAVCTPGVIKTKIGAGSRDGGLGPMELLPFAHTPDEGARPIVAAALMEHVPDGKMIVPYWIWEELGNWLPRVPRSLAMLVFELCQKLAWGPIRAHATSPESRDVRLQDELWSWSAKHVGVEL